MAITRGATITPYQRSGNGTDGSVAHTVDSGTTLLIYTVHYEAAETSGVPSWSLGGGETFTLIDETTRSGSTADVCTSTFALLNPTAGAGTISLTVSSNDNLICVAINYLGTETSSLAAAIQFIAEDVDNAGSTTPNTTVFSSAGTTGNTLLAVGTLKGGNGVGVTVPTNFSEIFDNNSGGTSSTADVGGYVCDYIGGAASACTWTWPVTNENASHYFQIVPAAGGSTDDLLANDVESDSEVSAPVIGQVHAILANDVQSASEVSSPVIGQIHALTADDVESASEVSTPAASESNILLANDVESASEVSSPALGQIHVILANDAESASEVSAPSVGQIHAILAADVESASEVTAPTVGQIHAILANDVQSTSEVSTPTLAENAAGVDALLANDVESASEVYTPTLAQVHVLFGTGVESTSEVSTPTIGGSFVADASVSGGRSRKRPRYVVEVDGELIQVASIADAEAVLLHVRELAQESAARDVTTPVTPKPPRVAVKTLSGKRSTSKVLNTAVAKTQKTVNAAYLKASQEIARDREISALLIKRIELDEQDDEEAIIALLM